MELLKLFEYICEFLLIKIRIFELYKYSYNVRNLYRIRKLFEATKLTYMYTFTLLIRLLYICQFAVYYLLCFNLCVNLKLYLSLYSNFLITHVFSFIKHLERFFL